ncbi:MAG: heavy-metal-associated domain-containing protein [Limnohabitans sp.]
MEQIFEVEGMSCQHCAKAVTKAVKHVDAEAQVQVDLDKKQVRVESKQPRAAIAQTIAEEGYTVAA